MGTSKLTKLQGDKMRHALGLDRKKRSYRNRFHAAVGSSDADLWTDLVSIGFAALINVEGGLILFTVTDLGRAALKEERGQ